MKKTKLFLLTALLPLTLSAQLKVTSEGKVGVSISDPVTAADLSLSYNDGYNYSSYAFGIRVDRRSTKTFNIGIAGRSINNSSLNRSIGVQGVAGGGLSGWRFGVLGGISDVTGSGAGIFGTTLQHTGVKINGRYAGYFNGEVYVDNNITATGFITPSDMRLKQNVESISNSTKTGSTLENVLNMNVIKYNYTDFHRSEVSDTMTVDLSEPGLDITKATHYGLSAQELQSLYPELVRKGQDGYLGINYVELVPILIRSIQELKEELDDVKGAAEIVSKSRSTTALRDAALLSSKLYQNAPNPFTERTEIRFTLAEDTHDAYIYIFDMTGKMLRQISVDSTMQSVTINGYELQAGIYLYSLVVGGQEVDTKRMILSK